MNQLSDTDMMPWGKYGPKKGDPRRMEGVPASYLHWCWTELGKKNETATCPVAGYVQRNIAALALEYPDGIW